MTDSKKKQRRGRPVIQKLMLVLAGLLAAGAVIIVILHLLGVIRIAIPETIRGRRAVQAAETPSGDDTDDPDGNVRYTVETIDADKYFEKNATIISRTQLAEEDEMYTEAEVFSVLRDRGFTEFQATYDHTMTGAYTEETGVSETSAEKHPTYKALYVNTANELWIVSVMGKDVLASPASYNQMGYAKTNLILSESETVTSYDGPTNTLFRTIPKKDALRVRVADRIDSALLDELTIEELKNEK